MKVPSPWPRLPLLLLLCAATLHAQQAPSIRRVHGLVVNAVTNAPIARALVTSADQSMALLTDAEGKFEFEVKASPTPAASLGSRSRSFGGSIFLMARKPGYRNPQRPLTLPLDDAALAADVRLKLIPEAIIEGRVSASGILPPRGVQVQLMARIIQGGLGTWRAQNVRQTDAAGEYRFADLAAGQYKILTREWTERDSAPPAPGKQRVGYPPAAFPSGTSLASAAILPLAAGETAQADLNLRPAPYFPIEVPVADEERTGLNVNVEDADGGPGFSLGYNQRTHQVEGGLPAGTYHLNLFSYGPVQRTAVFDLVVGGPVHTAPVSLVPTATIPVVVREQYTRASTTQPNPHASNLPFSGPLQLADAGPRQGIPPTPQPKVNVYLEPLQPDRNGAGSGHTDPPQGDPDSITIANVRPGSYRVKVTPMRGYASEVTAGGVDLLRQPLVVAPGGTSPTIEITLRDDTAALTGTVTDISTQQPTDIYGAPLTIWCYPLAGQGSDTLRQGSVGPTGKFDLLEVPPGRYLVLASHSFNPQFEYRSEAVMKQNASRGATVTLTAGQTANVTLTVQPGEDVLETDQP